MALCTHCAHNPENEGKPASILFDPDRIGGSQPKPPLSGFFNVDKPAGMTSHDVVAALRRAGKERRVGHAGTLDPMATGVLLVAVGSATRVIEYLQDGQKVYQGTVRFGLTTTSYDIEGEVVSQAAPDAVAATLAMNATIAAVAPRYRYMQRCVVIGRGYNYATAFETALKLKEMTYTIVEPYSSADFLHGPLAMLEPGFPAIVIAPSGRLAAEAEVFIGTLRERQAEVIAISDDAAVLAAARVPLALPASVPEWLSPLTAIIPGQLLALQLAHARDFDIDAPRAIRKVTETV